MSRSEWSRKKPEPPKPEPKVKAKITLPKRKEANAMAKPPAKKPHPTTVPRERYEQKLAQVREQQAEVERLGRRIEEIRAEIARNREQHEQQAAAIQAKTREFQAQAEEAKAKTKAMERDGWVEQAARRERFHESEDAARLIDPTTVKSAEEADRAVRRLAEAKPHLVKPTRPATLADLGVRAGGRDARDDGEDVLRAIRDAMSAPRDPVAPGS